MRNNDNITFVYFIVNSFDEKIFWDNKVKNRNENILVITPESYDLKNTIAYKHAKVKDIFSTQGIKSIFNYVNTDWIMLMKPEEAFIFNINTNKLEVGVYSLLIKKLITADNNNSVLYSDIKFFHKDYEPNKPVKFLNNIIFNYTGTIPEIENRKLKSIAHSYQLGNRDLKTILYLIEKRLIKVSPEELFEKYYIPNNTDPEMLELFRCIARIYVIDRNYDKAKDILFKALLDFPNSPDINSLLAEVNFILGDYNQAELFILNCLKMGRDKTFYMNLPFNSAIIGYASHYYLAKIYYRMEDYEKSKVAFEDCIDENPDFKIAVQEYQQLLKEMPSDKYVNELNFSCQGCGNCCRHFKTVNINHQDVLKIMENKPELKFDDIVDCYYEENIKGSLLSLKKKENSKDCMFLENNLCVINDFKPLGCQIWPFTIKSNSIVTWTNSNRAFIKDFCSYKEVEGANNREELMKKINLHQQNSNDLIRILKKWEDKISIIDNKLNPELVEEMKIDYLSKKA